MINFNISGNILQRCGRLFLLSYSLVISHPQLLNWRRAQLRIYMESPKARVCLSRKRGWQWLMSDFSLSWSGKYNAAKTSALFLMNYNLFQSHGLNIQFINSKFCNNLSKCFLSLDFKSITCVAYCDLWSLLIGF